MTLKEKPLPQPVVIELTKLTTAKLHPEQLAGEVFLGLYDRDIANASGWLTRRLGAPEASGSKLTSRARYPVFAQADELRAYGLPILDEALESA